jgi:hypothetical protein
MTRCDPVKFIREFLNGTPFLLLKEFIKRSILKKIK